MNKIDYKIMREVSIRDMYALCNYLSSLCINSFVSKNNDDRKICGSSILGILSIHIMRYDVVHIEFDEDINMNEVKDKIKLIFECNV